MSEYKDYVYRGDSPSHTHAYLSEHLLAMLGSPTEGSILDLGCGNGWMARRLLQKGFDVYGVDASPSGIAIAREAYPDRFFLQDLNQETLPGPLRQRSFSTVISTEVIEHLYDPKAFLAFCKNILQKSGGGELLLSTPYHGYWKNLALALSGKMDDHFTVLWEGGHIKFWSRKTLTIALEEQGFEVIAFRGAGRLPYFWKSMLIKARI